MPKYYEPVERRRESDRRGEHARHSSASRRRADDHWGAAVAGITLVMLPAAAGLYRGSLGWMDVVVALMGFALLAVAAHGAGRDSMREETR